MTCSGIDALTLVIGGVAIGLIAGVIACAWEFYGLHHVKPFPVKIKFGKSKKRPKDGDPEVKILGIR